MPHVSTWLLIAVILVALCASILGIAAKDWRTNIVSFGVAVLALLYVLFAR